MPVSPLKIALGVAGVIVVGVVIWLLVGVFSRFDVTVNGQKVTLSPGATVQTLLDQKVVEPKPGNLLAVDGSMLTQGAGHACTATIDGNAADVNSELKANNVVEITDGGDATEETDVQEKKLPFEKDEGNREFEAYWFGSIHLLSDGEDGVETTSTGKQSGKTVTEVTKEPINAGYRIYTAQPDDKAIALTFDDGPWPDTTNDILNILEENHAKATFFTIGNQIAQNKDVLKRAKDLGCQICTHTWDHAEGSGGGTSIAKMSATEQVDEIKKGYEAIKDALGEEPSHVIRAPGGNFYGDTINNVWDIVDAEIGWDVDTEDWSRPGADAIQKMILSVKPGQVILMHDGGGDRSQTVEALRQALPKLVEEGYKFVTIDELIAYGMPSSKSDIPSTSDEESGNSSSSSSSNSSSSSSDSMGTNSSESGTTNSSSSESSNDYSSGSGSSGNGTSDSSSKSSSGDSYGSSTESSNSSASSSKGGSSY